MAQIEISEQDLYFRPVKIKELLSPILGRTNYFLGHRVPRVSSGRVIYCANDGPLDHQIGFQESRFATFHKNFRASYVEIWDTVDGKNQFFHLFQSYLHIYFFDKENKIDEPMQILCLHCDPEESGISSQYKKGPHFHILPAQQPIPHWHIALDLSFQATVLSDMDSLSNSLTNSIKMIREEMLKDVEYRFIK